MQLTEHFDIEEFLASETATRMGIINVPTNKDVERLTVTARGMEHVRLLLGVPVLILSGLRCLELNAVVGGAMTREALEDLLRDTAIAEVREFCKIRLRKGEFGLHISQHVRGESANWHAPKFGTPLTICRALEASDLRFDQLIYEYGWVHTSFVDYRVPRREVLTKKKGTKGYLTGIVE
jgi:zinc D-Ala-D-Ala carboxypeptidase